MKNFLVTGASTGIGFDTVRILIEQGHTVIATVRRNEDEKNLKKQFTERLHVIIIELTDFEAIEKIPDILRNEFNINHLDGLVNNAGIALAAPFLNQDFNEMQSIMHLNVLTVLKLTQTLLPFLGATANSQHKGRIVNISSVAGVFATPFLAVYATSKHAIEGFSEALRKEMMLFGIKVIVVGPGTIKTPIWSKGFEPIKDKYSKSLFAASFARFISIALAGEKKGLEVADVSKTILHALTAENPKFRYAPIPQKFTNWYLAKIMPAALYNWITAQLLGLNKSV
jgi:short-subunit dehydrogenase